MNPLWYGHDAQSGPSFFLSRVKRRLRTLRGESDSYEGLRVLGRSLCNSTLCGGFIGGFKRVYAQFSLILREEEEHSAHHSSLFSQRTTWCREPDTHHGAGSLIPTMVQGACTPTMVQGVCTPTMVGMYLLYTPG